MAETSFPYTSVAGDRKVTALQEAQGFDMFVAPGVVEPSLGDLETSLEVSKVADAMQVSVAAGKAVIAGHRYISDAAQVVTLDAGGAQPRIDVIAAESNRNNDVRAGRVIVVKGTEAASPVAPALTETEAVYQIALAWVAIPAGATTLNGATLTDKRAPSRPRGMSSEATLAVQEFPYKKTCRAATTANLAALSGLLTVDGVTLEADDRILVKDQSSGAANGIYVASSGLWARATDMDTTGKTVSQMIIPIEQGTDNGGTVWQLTTASPITLDTTALVFARYDIDEITAGNGLQRTGNDISMRTPKTLSGSTTNAADETGHTHALDASVTTPTYIYKAAGSGDGEAISDLVNDFLEATGAWADTTLLTLKLVITGTLGLPTTPPYGDGTSGNPYRHFNFASTQTRGARVIIDWADARGLSYSDTLWHGKYGELIRQSGAGARISHYGLAAVISCAGTDCYGRGLAVVSDAELTLIDSYIKATGQRLGNAVYLSDNGKSIIQNCDLAGYCSGGGSASAESDASAVYANGGNARIIGSRLSATTSIATLTNNAHAYAARSNGNSYLVLENCDVIGMASGGQFTNMAYGAGLHIAGVGTSGLIQAKSCRILGYTDDSGYGVGYAVYEPTGFENGLAIQLIGCMFPVIAVANRVQTGAIYIKNTAFADCRYHISGNFFAGANSSPNISLPVDSSPAEDYYAANNMFGLALR